MGLKKQKLTAKDATRFRKDRKESKIICLIFFASFAESRCALCGNDFPPGLLYRAVRRIICEETLRTNLHNDL